MGGKRRHDSCQPTTFRNTQRGDTYSATEPGTKPFADTFRERKRPRFACIDGMRRRRVVRGQLPRCPRATSRRDEGLALTSTDRPLWRAQSVVSVRDPCAGMPSVLAPPRFLSLHPMFPSCVYDRHDLFISHRSFRYISFLFLSGYERCVPYHNSHACPSTKPPTPTRPLFTFAVLPCFAHLRFRLPRPRLSLVLLPQLVVYETVMVMKSTRSNPKI